MGLKAVTHQPITSGGPTTAGDVAVWSNTSGTLLSDSGISSSNLGLLNANQTWTGLNQFTENVDVQSLSFPSYGSLFSVYGGGAWSLNLHGGTDVNLSIQDGATVYGGLGSGVAFSSVNDAGTANEPMQFRSGGGLQLADFAGGALSITGYTNLSLDTTGNIVLGQSSGGGGSSIQFQDGNGDPSSSIGVDGSSNLNVYSPQILTIGSNYFGLDGSGNLSVATSVTVYSPPYSGSAISIGDSGIGHPGVQTSSQSLALQGGGGWGVDFYVDGGSTLGMSLDVSSNLTVTGGLNVASSINTTGDITATAGTGVITGNYIVKNGGLATQFLKADGTVDSNIYSQDKVTLHSGNYSVAASDYTVMEQANGSTVTLPNAATYSGRIFTVKNWHGSGGPITLASAGGNIDGNASIGMSVDFSYTLQSDGTNWSIIGCYPNTSSYVTGPASAVSGNLPSFNGTTGKTLQDSGVSAASVVTGPGSVTSGDIATFNGTTGKIVQDSGLKTPQKGSTAISFSGNNVTAVNVTFGTAFPSGYTPIVVACLFWNPSFSSSYYQYYQQSSAVSAISNTGFTFKVNTSFGLSSSYGGSGTIQWIAW